MSAYDDLAEPWQVARDKACQSFVAGSLGVGPGLAHAEIDALAALRPRRDGVQLWTTREPHLLGAVPVAEAYAVLGG